MDDSNQERDQGVQAQNSTSKTDRAIAGVNRRTLLTAVGLTGGGTLAYYLLNGSSNQKSSGGPKGTELDIGTPSEEMVQRYQSRVDTTSSVDPVAINQPDFATEEVIVTAESDSNTDTALFDRARVTPANDMNGDVTELTVPESQDLTTAEVAGFTRAILGVGTDTTFEATISTTTLECQGGVIPHTDSYGVVADHSSDSTVYLIRSESEDGVQQIADEVED